MLAFLASLTIAHAYLPRTPPSSYARSCRTVDYRTDVGPARISGERPWCFAYSSASLITQRTGVDVSAVDLATGFYLSDPRRFTPSFTVRAHLGERWIADLPRQTSRKGVDVAGRIPFLHHLEGGFEVPTLAWVNVRGLCADRHLPSERGLHAYREPIQTFVRTASYGRGTLRADIAGIEPRFRSPVADLFHSRWLDLVDASCKRRLSPIDILPVEVAIASDEAAFQRAKRAGTISKDEYDRVWNALDFALDHGRVAAIGFDLNDLEINAEGQDGDHSATVVARRRTRTGCAYLVRDSSGDPCSSFKPHVACARRHFWVREQDLARTLYSVVYLR